MTWRVKEAIWARTRVGVSTPLHYIDYTSFKKQRGFTFIGKLQALGMMILLSMLAFAIVFWFSMQRYNDYLSRINLAHNIFEGYLSVSNSVYLTLNTASSAVENQNVDALNEAMINTKELRYSLNQIHQGIASEVAFLEDKERFNEMEGFQFFGEIELLSEQITRGSHAIIGEVKQGNYARAQKELKLLRSDAVFGEFYDLIQRALENERNEVVKSEKAARRLHENIGSLLPMAVLILMLFGLIVIYAGGRKLAGSFQALNEAAISYTNGDLSHRIQRFSEHELNELARSFNLMAEQLAVSRTAVLHDQQALRDVVAERTRELQNSNEKLSRADRMRSRFLADISHELRTPLTIIQGEAEMALRGDNKNTEEYQEALRRVSYQVMHTARLVEDLLLVARSEEGQARFEFKPLLLSELLRECCQDFASLAEQRGITIIELYGDHADTVDGDKGRLRQVFSVLLDNALRYSNPGGLINVSTKLSGKSIKVLIQDYGIGISEEESEQAFVRFYRGSNATEKSSGNGLGLPVAKAIIEAHQGSIHLTGELHKGTTAVVSLLVSKSLGQEL